MLRLIPVLLIVGLCGTNGGLVECLLAKVSRGSGRLLNYSNVDDHVISEVLVSSNECVAMLILKADAF